MKPCDQTGSGLVPRLRDRLTIYFARNDEILSLSDICVKFGVNRTTAQACVQNMRKCGLLEPAIGVRYRTAALFVQRGPVMRSADA